MSALVNTERHLWLNLSGINEKNKTFLLNAPVSPLGLFGDTVDSVVTKFTKVKSMSEYSHGFQRNVKGPLSSMLKAPRAGFLAFP